MIMKAFVALVVLAVIFSDVQGEQMIGNCTMKFYVRKVQTCQTSFIHAMQKNPKSDCSVEMNDVVDCMVESLPQCFPTLNKALLKIVLQTSLTKDLLCDKAGLQSDQNQILSKPQNEILCKSTTWKQLTDKMNACTDKIVKMWQANKADKGTCSEYVNTKTCQIKVLETHVCNATAVSMIIDYNFGDNYNPFCPNGVDSTNSTNPTNTSLMARPSHGLLVLLVFAALVNSFKF